MKFHMEVLFLSMEKIESKNEYTVLKFMTRSIAHDY